MRLVRSDETVREGELVALEVLDELARRWYGNRLSPDWHPRSLAESQAILSSVGLTGEFWRL